MFVNKLKLIVLSIFVLGCSGGKHGPDKPSPSPNSQAVHEKYDREYAKAVTDFTPELYANPKDCDWTLWAGKAAAIGLPIPMSQVESAPGYLHRRPLDQGECYPDGAKSTISNDMITGDTGALWRNKDADGIQRVARFAADHAWFMGVGPVSDTLLKPALAILIAKMQNNLQNEDALGLSGLTPEYLPVSDDYAQHIQVLQIAYHGEVHGSITDQMKTRIQGLIGEHADNYTFQAVNAVYSGQYDTVYDLLLNDTTPVPSYVRGERPDVYARIEWLWAANLVVNQMEKQDE